MDKRDFKAWLAGFYEGEGSVGFYQHGKTHRLVLSITQKEVGVLEKIREGLGFGNVRDAGEKASTFYTSGMNVLRFCTIVYPFMISNYKRKQMEDAVNNYIFKKIGSRKSDPVRSADYLFLRERGGDGRFISNKIETR